MKKEKIDRNLKIRQFISFLACLMLMLVVPIWRDHRIIGIDLGLNDREEIPATLTKTEDGLIINTTEIGKEYIGYGGQTPIEIILKDDKIEKIKILPNQETPEFLGAVKNSDLLDRLMGLTLSEAIVYPLDGVSGATYTSDAIINNIRVGLQYGLNEEGEIAKITVAQEKITLKFYITIIVILAGGIIPLFYKDKRYRTLQLILNILLLGFWGGTFISYSQMTSFLSNGITQVALIPVALMLIAAFIYPWFGKNNYYCLWMCPYGSIQELAGKCVKIKIKLNPKLIKYLGYFRDCLWFILMWLLWTGLWFDWMGYEPFAAFFFTDASAVVLGIAGGFLLLSFFINRPYCRFVCPTGSLFKLAEGSR